jgi:N6-adenosine-specific RNA methylase IME4
MLGFHAFAEIFPLLDAAELDDLAGDIKEHGLRDKIVLLDDQILDGRNRYRAALQAGLISEDEGIEDRPTIFERFQREIEGDPLAYVISHNLKRRHLNDDQRRMVAAKLVNMGRGRPTENPAECGIKVADAARMVNVDEAGTERARTVLAKATPEIKSAVDRGKLTVAAATQAIKLEPDKQRRVAEEATAGHANVVRTVIKQETRANRERELGERQTALPQQKFGVIVADPEWRFEPWSRATGMDRAADNHYPTSCTEVIASRDVPSIAADDCVLFLWATIPMLPHALLVMAAWGFDYKSHYVWEKDKLGLGYWNREIHELLLIGTRGKIVAPAPGTQRNSVIHDPRGEHSEKPESFLELIEAWFPTLPKIELNRRGPARPGWSAWGFEAEQPAEAAE